MKPVSHPSSFIDSSSVSVIRQYAAEAEQTRSLHPGQLALIYNNQQVANKFIKTLSDNIVELEERLLKLAYNSVRKRVAEALLLLQQKYQQENTQEFTIAISRDDLSGIVGASKETVIRTLSDFKEEGLVQISGSKITLIKPDKLATMRN